MAKIAKLTVGWSTAQVISSLRRHLTIWIVLLLVFTYAIASYIARGNPAASVQLNDASVWVTRSVDGEVARLNHQIAELDAQVVPGGSAPDVVQNGTTVFTVSEEPGQLRQVNVASVALAHGIGLPSGAQVSLGGQTLSIRAGSDVWALPTSEVSSFDATHPTYTGLGGTSGQLAAVGEDGVVHAYSISNQELTNITLEPNGTTTNQSEPLATGQGNRDIVVSSVGSVPVVLDQDDHSVTVAGQAPVSIPTDPGEGANAGSSDPNATQIQQPGPGNNVVYVASNAGLFQVPLSGGSATKVSGAAKVSGDPAAPVFDDGCVNAAWTDSANYVYLCSGGSPAVYSIPGLVQSGSRLVFRVNGAVVVLNDAVNGQVWVLHNGLTQVADWAQFEHELNPDYSKNQSGTGPSDTSDSTRPPTANPVTFGVRPGRTSDLPVTLFDSDPNKYVMTLTSPTSLPASEGTLQIVDNGTQFQYTPPQGVTAPASISPFSYTISDGAGGNDSSSSTVTINVVPPSDTDPPKTVGPPSTLTVLQGATIRFSSLSSWYDPEADPFGLVGVSVPVSSGDQVAFTPSGQVSFRAGGAPGTVPMTLQVGDAVQTQTTQVVNVTVAPLGSPLKPQTTPFLAQATAGEPTLLNPLSIDTDPNDYPLTLASVAPLNVGSTSGANGLLWSPNYSSGTINFQASTPGIYYLSYVATDAPPQGVGPQADATTIRIDVADPSAAGPPVVMNQVAYLAPGGSALVPVLTGASDPAGNVLVVQSVTAALGSTVAASVYQGDQVRLTSSSSVSGLQVLSYTVSDGTQEASASINVLPSPAVSISPIPPVAEPVSSQAVVGDMTSIDPLSTDFDPQGGVLTLTPASVQVNQSSSRFPAGTHGVGTAFIDGSLVRYLPPDGPGQAVISYGVSDASGQTAESTITVTVSAASSDTSPPVPSPVSASVVAGTSVTIPVPLAGIDPLGESVTIIGLAPNPDFSADTSYPKEGAITKVGAASLTYEAYPNGHGTDSFYYMVRDKSGLTGVGSVRIGVAPAALLDADPVGVPQTVKGPPGKTLVVPVLEQDFDPQGYAIQFGPESELKTTGTSAQMSGISLEVTVPGSGQATVVYPIVDGHGASSTGVLTVVADPSALQLPIAQDIVVNSTTTQSASSVSVNILSHVVNPYGISAPMSVAGFSGDSAGTPTATGSGLYSIPLAAQPQTIAYTVKNQDGQASATITLPAAQSDTPQLVVPFPTISTPAGKVIELSITNYITDHGGKALRVAGSNQVQAANGTAVVQSATQLLFTPTPGYVGPASVNVAITNGAVGDSTAPSEVFTLPISVTGTNAPVTFYGPTLTAQIGKSESYSLTPYISSPNPGGVSGVQISALSAPAGLHTQINGQTLSITPQGLPVPSVQIVNLTLTQSGSTPVSGQIAIMVESSLAPLARTVPQTANVNQGQSVPIDVLSQDFDPFASPLVVSSPTVLGGGDEGTARTDGSTITFTAPAHFVGVSTIQYTVTDATKEQARQVQGTVAVTVFGAPDAPGAPSVLDYIGNGTVLLSWSAPPDNGKPITGYSVSSSPSSPGCTSTTTTCTVSGLTNGTPYTFTVIAINAVDPGPPSQPSSPVTPNNYPNQPAQPTATFGDGFVTVNWTDPGGNGTPVTCYQVQISPPVSPASNCLPVTPTSPTFYVWKGLTNGDSYSFEVRAENALGFGPWSPISQAVVPAGKPLAPGQPTVNPVPNDALGDQLAIEWPAVTGSGANGDAVRTYMLSTFQGSSQVDTPVVVQPTSSTENPITYVVTGLVKGTSYTFSVTAQNKAGSSLSSEASAPFVVYGAPDAPTAVTASQHQSGQTTLQFTAPPNTSGRPVTYYEYAQNGVVAEGDLPTNDTIMGLSNGVQYSFQVIACNAYYCSAPSSPAVPVVPDAPPTAKLMLSAGGATGSTFTVFWQTPTSAPPGSLCSFSQPGAKLGYSSGSSGPWTYVANPDVAGSGSFSGPYNQTVYGYVYLVDGCGVPNVVQASTISDTTVDAYNNYGGATMGIPMCRGNPNYADGHDVPGGSFSQTTTVPANEGTINYVKVQVDPVATVTVSMTLDLNGSPAASSSAPASGDTVFNLPDIGVSPGESVQLNFSLSDNGDAANGQIDTIYEAGAGGGAFTWSNSCVQAIGSNGSSTGNTLRAVVSGWGG